MTRPLAVALLLTLSLAACHKEAAPAPTPAPPEEAAPAPAASTEATVAPLDTKAALAVTGVETGTAVGADGKVSAPADGFAPTDTIIAAITLHDAGAPTSGNVTARWLAPDGKVVNEESQAREFSADETIDFRIANPAGFKAGAYKLEVSLNGSLVETRNFSVK